MLTKSRNFCYFLVSLVLGAVPFLTLLCDSNAIIRVKDIVNFEGVRENQLSGYGLVTGLNGSGDTLSNSGFTEKTIRSHLNRVGVGGSDLENNIKTKNVAAVMVTANLPPFSRSGGKISVVVSTIGDAKSLDGGVLISTPMFGADGNVYAVAQGRVAIGSSANNAIAQRSRKMYTNGFIMDGAIVEREIDFSMNSMNKIKLSLKNPDISTARAITNAINSRLSSTVAKAEDPGTIEVLPGRKYKDNMMSFLADIESLYIEPDQKAKIVIDEASGTVVFGENVKISKVAISHGDLIIKVSDNHFNLNKKEGEEASVFTVDTGSNLGDLVRGLNEIGVKTSDLISILKAIKQAGALQADIEIHKHG